jgi:nucleotide sugar dehydrogenase
METKIFNYKQALKNGEIKIGVWGCGYIGFTTMVNFAKEGVYSIGYDTNQSVIDSIKCGKLHIINLDYWIGYHIEQLVKDMIVATSYWKEMLDDSTKIHFIAVPTEKGGEPWFEPLQNVMDRIASKGKSEIPDIIIIESTLTPGMFDKIVLGTLSNNGWDIGKDVLVGIAPRRDWFDSPDKNLKSLNRVIGGTTIETTELMRDVLSIVCDKLILSDASTTELVKSVENTIFEICAVFASQLAYAYPDRNIKEVLKLASTHWRIPLYYPTVGRGGYCTPVAPKYIKDGAEKPDFLTLVKDTLIFDEYQPKYVAKQMAEKVKGGSIGILGLSYKRDLRVHTLSPALPIIKELVSNNIEVKVFDPYYTGLDIYQITGVKSFKYPEELNQFDGIIIIPPHRIFSQTPKRILLENLKQGVKILDNEGIWSEHKDSFLDNGIEYHYVGDKGWCL